MTERDSETADERRLQALFDGTSEPPSQQRLDRMARASARIPAQVGQGWFAWLRRRWRPATALAFAGAAALVAALWVGGAFSPGPGPKPPLAVTVPTADLAPTVPEPEDDVVLTPEEEEMIADLAVELDDEEEDVVETDPLAALDGIGHPLDALDLLFPPEEDAALDDWTAVYAELLEEG
ncbi:MAG: hypothetical protein JRI68_00390 [Deltaproteobacteria bacterium]|nr:hypothetical protein [Deltaproteobacteria bacterium]